MGRILIRIFEYGDHFGSLLIDCDSKASIVLDKCKNILYNYNRNLYNTDLPKSVLAVRLLQEANKEGTSAKTPAVVMQESEEFLEDNFKEYYDSLLFIPRRSFGRIAILRSDRDKLDEIGYSMTAVIDIGDKIVLFYNIGTSYGIDSYRHLFDANIFSLRSLADIPAHYNEGEYRFTLEQLNAFDDFSSLIKNNPKGFALPTGRIFVPQL